jgi:site-specific DNA-methyltransferase (adenine-specific)
MDWSATYPMNALYNEHCLAAMRQMPDDAFDLACVDPPYGGGTAAYGGRFQRYQGQQNEWNLGSEIQHFERESQGQWSGRANSRFGGRFDRYEIPANETTGDIRHWDVAPHPEYFSELFRVSKNQIIWGGNYFDLPPTRCFLIWQKLTISEKFSMAMAEYAWTSFNANAKIFACAPQGKKDDVRFHPTQKPLELMRWCISKAQEFSSEPVASILDTHAGSGSTLIAASQMGIDYMGFEIDKGYFDKAQERIKRESVQMNMSAQLFGISL